MCAWRMRVRGLCVHVEQSIISVHQLELHVHYSHCERLHTGRESEGGMVCVRAR